MKLTGDYSVSIMSNFARTVFYTGVTNDLERRVREHRSNEGSVFISKYKCHYLVYFEDYSGIDNALAREKQLKNWERKWKIELIRKEKKTQTYWTWQKTGLRERCRVRPGMTNYY